MEADPTAADEMGTLDPYSAWLLHLHLATDHPPTSHQMLAMYTPEPNALTDLREVLLAADSNIPSTRVESIEQRFFTLSNSKELYR